MNLADKKLFKIFQFSLKLNKNVNLKDIRRIAQKKWDSLAHVNIIIAIENEFNIKISSSDAENINSFKGAILLIKDKSKKRQ
tara:strand:+ start:3169 stop:3414 length:246 start_codon:yes stop_codon:yes gene_type:complete